MNHFQQFSLSISDAEAFTFTGSLLSSISSKEDTASKGKIVYDLYRTDDDKFVLHLQYFSSNSEDESDDFFVVVFDDKNQIYHFLAELGTESMKGYFDVEQMLSDLK